MSEERTTLAELARARLARIKLSNGKKGAK